MDVDLATINYLAVAASAVGTFVLGSIWYTLLFGKLWRRLQGFSDEKMKEMMKARPMPVFFGILIICYFVIAFVIAVLFTAFRIDAWSTGAIIGGLLWFGPAAAVGMTTHASEDKPIGVFLINATFQLIYLVGMGATIGGWH